MKIITDLGKIFTRKVKNISEKIAIICEIIEHNKRVGRATPTMGVARPRSVDY